MKYFSIFLQLVPYIIELCKNAESLVEGEKTGETKKAAVMSAVETLLSGVVAVSTGGQAETWAKIKPLVSLAVDIACKFLFKSA